MLQKKRIPKNMEDSFFIQRRWRVVFSPSCPLSGGNAFWHSPGTDRHCASLCAAARQLLCGQHCWSPGGRGQTVRPEDIPPSLVSWPLSAAQGVWGTKRGMPLKLSHNADFHATFKMTSDIYITLICNLWWIQAWVCFSLIWCSRGFLAWHHFHRAHILRLQISECGAVKLFMSIPADQDCWSDMGMWF